MDKDLTYKVQSVAVENFKGLTKLEVTLNGGHRTFIGMNGAGKTSLLQAMIMGLTGEQTKSNGKKLLQKEKYKLVANGAKSANIDTKLIEVETDKIVVISRKVSKSGSELTKIEYEDGTPIDPAFMDNLVSQCSVDVDKFFSLTPKQQTEYFGVDTSKHDAEIKEAKATLSDANKAKLAISAELKILGEVEEVEELESGSIQQELEDIVKHNKQVDTVEKWFEKEDSKLEALQAEHLTLEDDVDRIRRELEEAENKLAENNDNIAEQITFIKKKEDEANSKGALTRKNNNDAFKRLSEIDSINKKAREYQKYLATKESLETAKSKWVEAKQVVDTKERARVDYLQSLDMPREIDFDSNGGLLFEGKELDEINFNASKLMLIIIAISKNQGSRLKTFFIKNINLLDKDTLEKVNKQGYQLISEMVYSHPEDAVGAVFIKESKIVDSLDEQVKPVIGSIYD